MATLKLQSAAIQLTKAERAIVQRTMADLVLTDSRQRTTEMEQSFQRRKRFRNLLERELAQTNLDVNLLRQKTAEEHSDLQKAFLNRVRKAQRSGAGKRGGRKNAVWGLTSGAERPTYDLSWETHRIDGSFTQGDFSHSADARNGHLYAFGFGRDSAPKMVDSYAGVGFWYIPNRQGVLNISIAPALRRVFVTGAGWNDVGAAGGWISLGIASYLRDPFSFQEWKAITSNELWWNVDNWFDSESNEVDEIAHSMAVSTVVDTSHYYACWAWIRAYIYAENGDSMAGAEVEATVGSFIYALL